MPWRQVKPSFHSSSIMWPFISRTLYLSPHCPLKAHQWRLLTSSMTCGLHLTALLISMMCIRSVKFLMQLFQLLYIVHPTIKEIHRVIFPICPGWDHWWCLHGRQWRAHCQTRIPPCFWNSKHGHRHPQCCSWFQNPAPATQATESAHWSSQWSCCCRWL